jgi:serine/threonine protein kinase
MNPETLIGMALGKGVLQRLLGQGTMGAVYLAYEKDLQREVAIKVFFRACVLEESEREEFQTRLKQAIALGASLEHANIVATLDHGEEEGLVYEVMPCMVGGSLQALLNRSGALSFVQIQSYLEQLAAALDYAHTRKILHRDIKPSNILLTSQGDLLLSDFGVAGLTTEKNFARTRQPLPGMLNYIAPEYVLGRAGDQRADLYSLGVVLYQMVTGTTPFKGATLSETAMQHVKVAPASPCSLRQELPEAAGQVILRALAKHPGDRYTNSQELATAFRQALESAQFLSTQDKPRKADESPNALALLEDLASGGATSKIARISKSKRSSALLQTTTTELDNPGTQVQEQVQGNTASGTEASISSVLPGPKRSGLLSYANLPIDTGVPSVTNGQEKSEQVANASLKLESQQASYTEELRATSSGKMQSMTGLLSAFSNFPQNGENTGTIKLTEPVKIVRVPIAGQPGRFVTGVIPIATQELSNEQVEQPLLARLSKRTKLVSLLLAALLVLIGSGFFLWSAHSHNSSAAQKIHRSIADVSASATTHATETMQANIILSDDLSQNIHDWPVGTQGDFTYTFKDKAYHIANNNQNQSAPALLPNKIVSGSCTYSLTMEQIKGDETSPNNQFGMILYATVQNTGGKQIDKFYAFEVLNMSGGEYQFWKYDNSPNQTQDGASPWTKLWHQSFGKEFRQGSGSSHANMFKIVANAKTFTFFINGKQVGSFKDSSFSSGGVGMLVNLDGAEVAFSNLLLTHS